MIEMLLAAGQTVEVVKQHFNYGPYILVMLPIVAGAVGWWITRKMSQSDAKSAALIAANNELVKERQAHADQMAATRQESVDRHTKANNEQVGKLAEKIADTQRLQAESQQRLTDLYVTLKSDVSEIKGELVGRRAWDGTTERRGDDGR